MDNTIVGYWPVGVGGLPTVTGGFLSAEGLRSAEKIRPVVPAASLPITASLVLRMALASTKIPMFMVIRYGTTQAMLSRLMALGGMCVFGAIGLCTALVHAMSLQPQKVGPWYWLYNQIGSYRRRIFKFRTLDRVVLINNTFLTGTQCQGQYFMKFFMRNNLFIGRGGIWRSCRIIAAAVHRGTTLRSIRQTGIRTLITMVLIGAAQVLSFIGMATRRIILRLQAGRLR